MTTQQMDTVGIGRGGRMSRQRKRYTVLRLLRGGDLDTVSRSLGVTAATLSSWRVDSDATRPLATSALWSSSGTPRQLEVRVHGTGSRS
jgi:hypothetical protein